MRLDRILADSNVLEENKKDAANFAKYLLSRNVSIARAIKYLNHLAGLFKLCQPALRQATKSDIIDLINAVNFKPEWIDWTKRDYKITAKIFFRWVDANNDRASLIKAGKPKRKLISESQVITPEEIRTLAKRAPGLREKTILLLLYECAGGPGELCKMKVKDAYEQAPFLMFHLPGEKTAYRNRIVPIQAEDAIALFKEYLKNHPKAYDQEAPLWLNGWGKPLTPPAIAQFMRRLKVETGLTKRFNPYWLRHSKLTALGQFLPEKQLQVYAGHSPTSTETATYVHAGLNSLTAALLKQAPEGLQNKRERITREVLAEALKNEDFIDLLLNAALKSKKLYEFADAWKAPERKTN
jgi:site-specific recombinase XerD